eukprot:1938234-Pleurochrysis_carterae.AAC.2
MKKQLSVALSTREAEIMAGSLAACKAVYLRGLLTEWGFAPPGPTELHVEDFGAINLAHDSLSHAKSKHIHRREHKICGFVADGTIKPKYVKSQDIMVEILPSHLAALLSRSTGPP